MKRLKVMPVTAMVWMLIACVLTQAQSRKQYTQTVNPADTSLTLTLSKNPATVGDGSFASTVLSGIGPQTPTGSVTFSASLGGVPAGTAVVTVDASGASQWVFNLAPGVYNLTAVYSGDIEYKAESTTGSLTVVQAMQMIKFAPIPSSLIFGAPPISLSATSSNPTGAPITFSVLSGPATVSNGILRITGPGSITVAANQLGSTNFSPAPQVTQMIGVSRATPSLTWPATASITYGIPLGATQLNATATGVDGSSLAGTFSYTPAAGSYLTAGSQALNLLFTPSDSQEYGTQTATNSILVNKASSALSNLAISSTFTANGPLALVPVSIAGQYAGPGILRPSGNVGYSFVNPAGATIFTGTTSISAGLANIAIGLEVPPGTYVLNVGYSGDTNYNGSASPIGIPLQVLKNQPALVWPQLSSLPYGTSLASLLNASALNGTSPVAGSFTYTATVSGGAPVAVTNSTVLPVGNYTLAGAFTPADPVTYGGGSIGNSLSVTKITPAISLSSSSPAAFIQTAVTFTATVSSPVSAPSGTVTFLDGATAIGTATLANGAATLSVSNLTLATHTINAIYSGDNNFLPVNSSSISEEIGDFTLTFVSGGTSQIYQTASVGQTASYVFAITPSGNKLAADVTFSASGLPDGAVLAMAPPSMARGSSAGNVTMNIQLPLEAKRNDGPLSERRMPLGFALLLIPFSIGLRKSSKRLGRLLAVLLLVGAGLAGTVGLTGCGDSFHPNIHTVTFTASSGALSHSSNVTLVVE